VVSLDPTVGSEMQKPRPAVVVSPDEMNHRLNTVLVAPLTKRGFVAPFQHLPWLISAFCFPNFCFK
jgi:mRNA interferase MazF